MLCLFSREHSVMSNDLARAASGITFSGNSIYGIYVSVDAMSGALGASPGHDSESCSSSRLL